MNNKRYFFITIDTEADNQWFYDNPITTENTLYLPRFQELCERYNFIPVWLTDYEMANDERFVSYFSVKQRLNKCEIGMHLHGWTTPPVYDLPIVYKERPFIYEYPINIIDEKVKNITQLLKNRFGIEPISHRAGRWAINKDYLSILSKYGYKIDCSITPGINWNLTNGQTGIKGPDFSNCTDTIITLQNFLEIPVTIKQIKNFNCRILIPNIHLRSWIRTLIYEIKNFNKPKIQWLRPDKKLNFRGIKKIIDLSIKNNEGYLMFMIHSSELMPGGSPSFPNKKSIERLYKFMEKLFLYIKKNNYEGISLKEFYLKNKNNN